MLLLTVQHDIFPPTHSPVNHWGLLASVWLWLSTPAFNCYLQKSWKPSFTLLQTTPFSLLFTGVSAFRSGCRCSFGNEGLSLLSPTFISLFPAWRQFFSHHLLEEGPMRPFWLCAITAGRQFPCGNWFQVYVVENWEWASWDGSGYYLWVKGAETSFCGCNCSERSSNPSVGDTVICFFLQFMFKSAPSENVLNIKFRNT